MNNFFCANVMCKIRYRKRINRLLALSVLVNRESHRAMYGYVWLCVAMYGYVWLCMAMYGYVYRSDYAGYVCMLEN